MWDFVYIIIISVTDAVYGVRNMWKSKEASYVKMKSEAF